MGSQFDTCAQEYHNFRPEYPESLFQFIIERFALTPGAKMIDVGCGTARAALPFAARGLAVIGIDPSLEMLKFAQTCTRAPLAVAARIKFAAGRGETLGLRDGCAQLVNCAQSFHWFDAQAALLEFDRSEERRVGKER